MASRFEAKVEFPKKSIVSRAGERIIALMKTATHYAFEIIYTQTAEVACDGGSTVTGHPRVFLHIKPEEGEIVCPYCSRTYRLEQGAH